MNEPEKDWSVDAGEVRYIEPHAFLFGGSTHEGNDAWVVIHYA